MDPVSQALREDGAFRDVSSPLVPNRPVRASLLAKQDLVVAGMDCAVRAFRLLGVRCVPACRDGSRVRRGRLLGAVRGPARRVLAAERTALNFLQQLSGVATLTRRFVDLARPARIYDTRKTVPGLRVLQKAAVRSGGGFNHRLGLHDGAMIKDNHLAAAGGEEALRDFVEDLRRRRIPVVIEASTPEQALLFSTFPVRVLMLDNFSPAALRRWVPKVRAISPTLEIEASGGVTLETVKAVARSGVDRISVGALTHSAPACDISLEF
jgi:nicotinate-nucleotide pyrophosphorylase (carboxylating)